MDELPEELLIEIFSYFKFNDLCQLTLTCKLFNEIIGNSSTLMDAFCYVHDGSMIHCRNIDRVTKRSYRRIKVKIINESLMKLLGINGKNICEIKIHYYNEIKMQDFRAIFTFCPNVKQLIVDIRKLAYTNDDLTQPVLNLSLNSLVIKFCDSKIFKILQITAENISVDINCNQSMCKNALVDLLRNQKQLKTLILGSYCNQLFVNDSLANVELQLKTFIGDFQTFDRFRCNNFLKFLTNQKNLCRFIGVNFSHKTFKLKFANVVSNLENLKELNVSKPYNLLHPMPYVEKLCTHIVNLNENFQYFHNLFPNVNYLRINSIHRIKFVKNSTESNLNSLTNYAQCEIPKNLKSLEIRFVKFGNESLFDDNVEINIENLTIICSDNIDWLIECLKNDRMKLKSLTIEATRMKKSQREYLESLTRSENKKIEKLKIYMPMKFYSYVCNYHMENDNECAKRRKMN